MTTAFRRWRATGPAGLTLALLAWAAAARPAAAAEPAQVPPPAVPGYERLAGGAGGAKSAGMATHSDRTVAAKPDPVAAGQVLLGELNCLSCHKAPENQLVAARPAPDLGRVGQRVTPHWLAAYLADPQAVKPGTAMPSVFHASEPAAKQGAVEFLTHYLVSLGGPMKPGTEEGTKPQVQAGERLFHSVGCVACHAPRGGDRP